jgi:hypothetical protein
MYPKISFHEDPNNSLPIDYIPMDYPEVVQFIPEISFNEEFQFQFNPIPVQPRAPDQSQQYDLMLAKAAYQAGVPFHQMLEYPND